MQKMSTKSQIKLLVIFSFMTCAPSSESLRPFKDKAVQYSNNSANTINKGSCLSYYSFDLILLFRGNSHGGDVKSFF